MHPGWNGQTQKKTHGEDGFGSVQCGGGAASLAARSWANQEFQLLETKLQEEADIPLVMNMDIENAILESFLEESGASLRKTEVEAVQLGVDEEEIFLQT